MNRDQVKGRVNKVIGKIKELAGKIVENKELETGITIHYVNKNYDEGEFIFQKNTSIINCKTPEEVAQKIHELEMEYFPKEIENLLISKI